MRLRNGLSLIELLVVLAVLGILFGVVGFGMRGLVARSAVQEASQTVARTIDRARTEAKRRNETLHVVANATLNEFEIRLDSTVGSVVATQALPRGTEFTGALAWNTAGVGFDPPYGALNAPIAGALSLGVRWVNDASIDRTVSITGVFGKVAIQ